MAFHVPGFSISHALFFSDTFRRAERTVWWEREGQTQLTEGTRLFQVDSGRCLLASTFSGEVWFSSSGLWFGVGSFLGSCVAASCSGLSRPTLGTCNLCSTLHSETQGSHIHTVPHVGTRSPRFHPVNSFSFAKHVRVTFKGVYRLT